MINVDSRWCGRVVRHFLGMKVIAGVRFSPPAFSNDKETINENFIQKI